MTRDTSPFELSLDTVFELLANAYRRHLLYYFHERGAKRATVADFCTHLQNTVAEDSSAHHIRLRLRHQHLSKLADHNVIEYDARSKMVRYRGGTRLEALLVTARHLEASA
jgi:hypothetical protein